MSGLTHRSGKADLLPFASRIYTQMSAMEDKLKFSLVPSTKFDSYTANRDHAHGQDPNRSPATMESLSPESQSVLPALWVRRMDRPDHPRDDNDIVERNKSPSRVPDLPS